MSKPHITYFALPDTTAEGELSTLANIYSFVLRCANKNAPGMSSTKGDDAKERSEDVSSARQKYTG
jgi:hypothetical protein